MPDLVKSRHFATTTSSMPNKGQRAEFSKGPPVSRASTGRKPAARPNKSILNFFGKTDKIEADRNRSSNADTTALFFDDKNSSFTSPQKQPDSVSRFNEDDTPVKRRRMSNSTDELIVRTPSPGLPNADENCDAEGGNATKEPVIQPPVKRRGGFVDDDSDDEDVPDIPWAPDPSISSEDNAQGFDASEPQISASSIPLKSDEVQHVALRRKEASGDDSVPSPSRDGATSWGFQKSESTDQEDFENDEFYEGGEEFMERQFILEQQEMERAFEEESKLDANQAEEGQVDKSNESGDGQGEDGLSFCPVCSGSLKCLNEAEASSHVNACLDGNAPPLPQQQVPELPVAAASLKKAEGEAPSLKSTTTQPPNFRFQRAAAIARPAQASPFSFSGNDKSSASAFSRIMSGHAESAAWAEAAANEASSRGKMAYQRTCPFYKIMPGFAICVDAFRYGKVEGQSAYFLSHFHSDHYVGLTSSWCHGPIYASKVTCNLMKQQLRVDPAWIVPLEFEQKVEVPNTNGVFVTMIPANHCPGSSLFLFEKATGGKNRDGSAKLTRVLHCGDFRACRAHVAHPLLQPDVVDSITGATRQQVIDTCYLDTTYLTPKYSFPSQEEVISACAQMCVSLSRETADPADAWETAVAETTGTGAGGMMTRFLESGKAKVEADEGERENNRSKADNEEPRRGRLLVVIGTYSIGKERICVGIARALGSKIYAPPGKMKICRALEDEELNRLLTPHPLEAQVHMQTLMEIRAETLHDYLVTLKPAFSRVVGFRPTGWNYRPPPPPTRTSTSSSSGGGSGSGSGRQDSPSVSAVLHSEGWKSRFTCKDLLRAEQRGSTAEAKCFGVPYSEHSSFRELTMFVCALRINRVVPTVNVGSAASRDRMKGWIEKWDMEKRKNGLFKWESTAIVI